MLRNELPLIRYRSIKNVFQLLRGSTDAELKQYELTRDPANYHYTNQGSTETLSERNDYKATVAAFKAFGFTAEETSSVWRTSEFLEINC